MTLEEEMSFAFHFGAQSFRDKLSAWPPDNWTYEAKLEFSDGFDFEEQRMRERWGQYRLKPSAKPRLNLC